MVKNSVKSDCLYHHEVQEYLHQIILALMTQMTGVSASKLLLLL